LGKRTACRKLRRYNAGFQRDFRFGLLALLLLADLVPGLLLLFLLLALQPLAPLFFELLRRPQLLLLQEPLTLAFQIRGPLRVTLLLQRLFFLLLPLQLLPSLLLTLCCTELLLFADLLLFLQLLLTLELLLPLTHQFFLFTLPVFGRLQLFPLFS
jgi:hypothetical protein